MFLYFSNLYFKQVIFCSKNIILKGKGHLCFDIISGVLDNEI